MYPMIEFAPSASPVAELIRGRRTVTKFQPQPPPRELILQAIDLARWAPNHKHTEPWRFHVLGPECQARIVGLNARLVEQDKGPEAAEAKRRSWSGVPGWLAVTCIVDADPFRAGEDYAACCCAVQNLMLFLWSEGVGTKWSTGPVTRHPEFYHMLHVDPAAERSVGVIWYGYPESVPESRRKPVEEIVSEWP